MTTAMKHSLHRLALLAALAWTGHDAMAQHEVREPAWHEVALAQNEPRVGPRIPMADATEMVLQRTGGRVLNAQEARQDGRDGYRIKVLTRSGEVRVFFVDASSGAMQQD